MRYLKHSIRNLGPFDEVSVDIGALDGPLVAVCGENGAGKSTFLELLLGAIWRTTPTRGSLIDLATARDASVETEFEFDGRGYRIRQLADAVSRKGEALLTDAGGTPLVESTKRDAVDTYVAEHFPPLGVMLVSTFIPQQSQGILDAKDRRSMFLRLIGIDRVELLAEGARKKAGKSSTAFDVAARMVEAERSRSVSVEEAERSVASAEEEQARALAALAEERSRAELARVAGEEAARRAEEIATKTQERRRIQSLVDAKVLEERDLAERIRNNEGILAQADAIKAAERELAESTERRTAIASRLAELMASKKHLLERSRARGERHGELIRESERAARLVSTAADVRARASKLDAARAGAEDARSRVEGFKRRREELRQGRSDDRIADLRGGLVEIGTAADLASAQATATRTLEADARAASAPEALADLEVELAGATGDLERFERETAEGERAAAAEPAIKAAEEALETAKAAMAALLAEQDTGGREGERIDGEVATLQADRDRLEREGADLERLARRAKQLAAAEARIEELRPQLTTVATALGALREELAAVVVPEPLPRVDYSEESLRSAERREREGSDAVAVARKELERAREAGAKLAELEAERDAAAVEHSDWERLAADLGKKGLQAALIDAALPELVAITNSLLHASYGPRFTVDIRTQALDSKGKRLVERLDIIVFDSKTGGERRAETYSGGERAIIAEGLSLAMTTLAARDSGIRRPTIVRDEAGAALDPEKGRAWIAMLRQACQMMDADKLLFVSHSPELAALADSRIEL